MSTQPRSNFLFVAVAIACLGLWIGTLKVAAGFYADGTTSEQTIAFGVPFAGRALAFRINVPGVGTGQRNTSATFFNSRYAITAAHNVTDLLVYNPTYEVADGTNFLTARGNVMAVTSVLIHPSQDLAILQFAAPFYAAPNQTIGSVVNEDITYLAGFGQWGTPATGIISPRDGSLRAWDAQIWNNTVDAPYRQQAGCGFFAANPGLLTFGGRAMSGDSGGPVFNSNSNLVGVIVTGNTWTHIMDGSTGYMCLAEPSIKAWIEANTALPAPVLNLGVSPTGPAVRLAWDADAIGYRLQTSDSLTTWTNLGNVLTGPGTLDDPIANRPHQFYRLAKP